MAKSPDEVPESVRREMAEIGDRARGAAVKNLLWERGLTDSDRQWIEANLSLEQWRKLSPVAVWMRLRGVSDGRAALDVALKCDLLTPQKYAWLSREIGVEDEGPPVEALEAITTARLVLIETPPSAYWCGKEIACGWERHRVLWDYFLKLARAAKLRRPITPRDFDLNANARSLTNWKSRLLKIDELFEKIGDFISSKHGKHRLELPPEQIRIFQHVPGEGLREVRH